MKRCTRCGIMKRAHAFYKDARMRCGVKSECRACHMVHSRPARLAYSRSVHGRFVYAKSRAARFGRLWTLTEDQYACVLKGPCAYCGYGIDPTGSGLDQKIPSAGYTPDNVVACCGVCNQAKMDEFTYDEMLVIGAAIKKVRDARS